MRPYFPSLAKDFGLTFYDLLFFWIARLGLERALPESTPEQLSSLLLTANLQIQTFVQRHGSGDYSVERCVSDFGSTVLSDTCGFKKIWALPPSEGDSDGLASGQISRSALAPESHSWADPSAFAREGRPAGGSRAALAEELHSRAEPPAGGSRAALAEELHSRAEPSAGGHRAALAEELHSRAEPPAGGHRAALAEALRRRAEPPAGGHRAAPAQDLHSRAEPSAGGYQTVLAQDPRRRDASDDEDVCDRGQGVNAGPSERQGCMHSAVRASESDDLRSEEGGSDSESGTEQPTDGNGGSTTSPAEGSRAAGGRGAASRLSVHTTGVILGGSWDAKLKNLGNVNKKSIHLVVVTEEETKYFLQTECTKETRRMLERVQELGYEAMYSLLCEKGMYPIFSIGYKSTSKLCRQIMLLFANAEAGYIYTFVYGLEVYFECLVKDFDLDFYDCVLFWMVRMLC